MMKMKKSFEVCLRHSFSLANLRKNHLGTEFGTKKKERKSNFSAKIGPTDQIISCGCLSKRKLKLYHSNYFPYELTTDRKCFEENYDSVMSE